MALGSKQLAYLGVRGLNTRVLNIKCECTSFVVVMSMFKTNVLVCSRPRFDSRFLYSKFSEFLTIKFIFKYKNFDKINNNLIYAEVTHVLW